MIKVDESQKTLNLFELDWYELISNDDNLLKVHVNAVDLNEKVQIEDFLSFKHTFLNVHIESEFSQADQDQTNMLIILLFIVTVD